ncbi:MAG: hypothetical protein Q7J35_05805 [Candidatus Methanoperedens sp.]|nr:hypothetical protein [Candidatus Methanoperedens sp.]
MKKKDEFQDVYEDVVIENYGIPVVITDVLVRKHKITGRNIYINHPDSIHKIEKGLKAALALITPIGTKKAIVEFE